MKAIKTAFLFAIAALLSSLFAAGTSPVSYACECAQRTQEEYFDQAFAVFAGKVVDVDGQDDYLITFSVSRYWKGLSEGDGLVTAKLSSLDGNTCGYPFQEGKEYLTYAFGSSGQLHVGGCYGTVPVADAGATLGSLGAGAVPDTIIHGKVLSVDPGAATAPRYTGFEGTVPAIIVAAIAGLGVGITVLIIRKPKVST